MVRATFQGPIAKNNVKHCGLGRKLQPHKSDGSLHADTPEAAAPLNFKREQMLKKKTVEDKGRIQEIAYNVIVLGATKGAITLLIVEVSGELQVFGTAS